MKESLKDLLTPADDGSAFTEAVLLKASGALHRRRSLADGSAPAWEWLAQWARPWVVAALVAVAALALIPTSPWAAAPPVAATTANDSDVMTAALLPADLAVATANDVIQER